MSKYVMHIPKTPLLNTTRTEYTKSKKYKCRQYKQSILKKLKTILEENCKSYWKLIDKLRGIERDNVSKAVDPPTWVSHFQNLNTM